MALNIPQVQERKNSPLGNVVLLLMLWEVFAEFSHRATTNNVPVPLGEEYERIDTKYRLSYVFRHNGSEYVFDEKAYQDILDDIVTTEEYTRYTSSSRDDSNYVEEKKQAIRQAKVNLDRKQVNLDRKQYIDKFKQFALAEARFGVNPSVTLAQGAIESNNGNGQLSLASNNHFGLKIGTIKTIKQSGTQLVQYLPNAPDKHKNTIKALLQHINFVLSNTVNKSTRANDDAPNEEFATFKTIQASYAAHTLLLLLSHNYVKTGAKDVDPYQQKYRILQLDYRGQLAAIKSGGYATKHDYDTVCRATIENLNIDTLDNEVTKRNNSDTYDSKLMNEVIKGYLKRLPRCRNK